MKTTYYILRSWSGSEIFFKTDELFPTLSDYLPFLEEGLPEFDVESIVVKSKEEWLEKLSDLRGGSMSIHFP